MEIKSPPVRRRLVAAAAAKPPASAGEPFPDAPLTQASQALESSRDSGFDLSAAVGELVDNSYEAKARNVRIKLKRDGAGSVTDLAVSDDGVGIEPDVLAHVLSLGYSSRYNSRESLGRFGMGLKLSSLSQARRVEVYTKTADDEHIYYTYLDLDEVKAEQQVRLKVTVRDKWPADFNQLMQKETKSGVSKPIRAGTIVIWRKIDRLTQGGRFGDSVEERLSGLRKFLARAYRRFIADGFKVELEGDEIWLHDPLFLLETPRVSNKFKGNTTASIVDQGEFLLDGKSVKWTVTLLPKQFRRVQGGGGRAGKGREEYADLFIPDNESKISLLRNQREIYYDLVPKLYPGGKDKIDRYIGVEVEFPAALDEYFQVRNVKRGAEPVSKLREELKKGLEKPIKAARKRIRDYWRDVKQEEELLTGDTHVDAHRVVDAYQTTAPEGRANTDMSDEEIDGRLAEVVAEMGFEEGSEESRKVAKWLGDSLENRSLTLIDVAWSGRELLDIEHLTGKAIVKINKKHPFFTNLLGPLRGLAEADADELNAETASDLLRKLAVGIDLLILAYAKAENMALDPEEAFGDLRSDWGRFANGLIREAMKMEV